jgi:ribosomal protein S18 acetylase RimI-like enzyme
MVPMSTLLTIREAEPSDAAQIAQVNLETWLSTYHGILDEAYLQSRSLDDQVSIWQSTLAQASPSENRFVAVAGNQVVGYCGGGRNPDTRSPFQSELFGHYILKQYQNQGLGKQLTHALARWLQKQGSQSLLVWVMDKNPYRRFYEKIGGELLDQTRDLDYGGKKLTVVSYGWLDLNKLVNL